MNTLRFVARLAPFSFVALASIAASAQEPAPVEVSDPMAGFARMTPGQWRKGSLGDWKQSDTWAWGPGRHSLRDRTEGTDAEGDPWRVLSIYYWHPGRRQVRLLSLHPHIPGIGRGVSEGSIEFAGERADAVFDLWQPLSGERPRKMGLRWRFDGPDAYRESLLEASGSGEFTPLAAWDYTRVSTPTPIPAWGDRVDARPPEHLRAFEALLGRTWSAQVEAPAASPLRLESTFEWIPLVEVVHARVSAPSANGEPTYLLDAYVYHHPTRDVLRCLVLSVWGSAHEGLVSVLEDGALRFDLEGHDGEHDSALVVRLDSAQADSQRLRVWTVADAERTLALDTVHSAVEPK